jgi:hypothetical protein
MIILPNPFIPLSVETESFVSTDQEVAAVEPQAAAADPEYDPDAVDDIHEIFQYYRGGLPSDRFVLDEDAFTEALEELPMFLRVG